MKEEKYSIKRPEHIVIGDPWYFETMKGKRLAELTVDYRPPTEFAAAVSLSEIERYGMKGFRIKKMSISGSISLKSLG